MVSDVVVLVFVFCDFYSIVVSAALGFPGQSSFASFVVVLRSDKTLVVWGFEVVCISFIFLVLIKIMANLLPFPSKKIP